MKQCQRRDLRPMPMPTRRRRCVRLIILAAVVQVVRRIVSVEPRLGKVDSGRTEAAGETAWESTAHAWAAHPGAPASAWRGKYPRSAEPASAAVSSVSAKPAAIGREEAAKNIRAAAAAIWIAAGAAAKAAIRRAPSLIRRGVRPIRKPPLLIRHNLSAPLLDDVHVVRTVAQVDCAAILSVAAFEIIGPLEIMERPDLRVLCYALAIRPVVRVQR